MQIPSYWAEARAQHDEPGRRRPRTIRRYGWSDTSQDDAQRHADQRAATALELLLEGKHAIPSRERKLPYGDEGLPIREEVLVRSEDDVITRNAYGARCLNQPDVLFVDIDFQDRLTRGAERVFRIAIPLSFVACLTALIVTSSTADPPRSRFWLFVLMILLPIVLATLRGRRRRTQASRDAHRAQVRFDVARTASRLEPGCKFAVYETPAGLRLLGLHRTYDPRSEETAKLFRDFRADPAFAQMCALQACFRARVSPKPWRIEMDRPPSRGVWPITSERKRARDEWVERYEAHIEGFAACRYLEDVGNGHELDKRCITVQKLHDSLCRARSNLPIA